MMAASDKIDSGDDQAPLPTHRRAIRIIGVGNPLMGDDGAGIAVVSQLEHQLLPAYVEVIDGGEVLQ